MPLGCPVRLVTACPPTRAVTVHVRLSHPPSRVHGLGHSAAGFYRNQSGQLQAPGQRGPRSGVAEVKDWSLQG